MEEVKTLSADEIVNAYGVTLITQWFPTCGRFILSERGSVFAPTRKGLSSSIIIIIYDFFHICGYLLPFVCPYVRIIKAR